MIGTKTRLLSTGLLALALALPVAAQDMNNSAMSSAMSMEDKMMMDRNMAGMSNRDKMMIMQKMMAMSAADKMMMMDMMKKMSPNEKMAMMNMMNMMDGKMMAGGTMMDDRMMMGMMEKMSKKDRTAMMGMMAKMTPEEKMMMQRMMMSPGMMPGGMMAGGIMKMSDADQAIVDRAMRNFSLNEQVRAVQMMMRMSPSDKSLFVKMLGGTGDMMMMDGSMMQNTMPNGTMSTPGQ